jgi:type III pantothenate kinase
MNLIIDIGNSGTKLAVYNKGIKTASVRFDILTKELLEDLIVNHSPDKAIISSVTAIPSDITEVLREKAELLHILSHNSKLPFPIDYETPETLGPDRIAAVAGAFNAFKGSDALVIDAGTAITFDLLTGKRYRGGNISPGIDTRFRSLNMFTGRLPLLSRAENFRSPGLNTTDAIVAGVIMGVIFEINEYIRTFEEKHKHLKFIITGGDGEFLKERIPEKVLYMPDIVTEGLNFILEYNAK